MNVSPDQELFEKLSFQAIPPPPAEPAEKGEPEPSTPLTLLNLFRHPDLHPVVLNFCLQKAFGDEWYHWEPETIWEEIQDTFKPKNISLLCKDKIRALQVIHNTISPWQKWQVFEKVAQPLNNVIANFQMMQILNLDELYVAVDILNTLRQQPFSDEVKLYMAGTVLHDDVFFVPPPLDFLQVEVSQPHYRCNDCGTEESALFHDGYCSNCTDRMHPEQGMSMKPLPANVAAGKGKNLTTVLRYDHTPIEALWNKVKDEPFEKFVLDENDMVSVQVQKLLMCRDIVNIRRKQLAEQLTTLKSWLGAP